MLPATMGPVRRWVMGVAVAGSALAAAGCGGEPPRSTVVRVAGPTEADRRRAVAENAAGADLLDHDKPVEAAAALERATAADPGYGPAANNLGIARMRLGQPAAAAAAFERAGELMPRAAPPRDNLGLLFESAGRFDDAVRCYDAAAALAPGDVESVANGARARVRRGDRTDELRAMLERVAGDPRPGWSGWARAELARRPRAATGP